MGIVRQDIVPGDAPYLCVCGSPMGDVLDVVSYRGRCSQGMVCTFSHLYNVFHCNPTCLEIFEGEDIFMLDSNPLVSSHCVDGWDVHCNHCLEFFGWYMGDQYFCLRDSFG